MFIQLAATFSLILSVSGYATFQSLIPNGPRVPNPCNPTELWPGVGHKLVGGTGDRNPFGLDFFTNNKAWTKELCMKDSDGDGYSNGAELGDPDCTWTPNSVPKFSANLSHPGVCEPIDSMKCMGKNPFLNCSPKFSCPAFDKNTTKKVDLFLPSNSSVPANETTYICQAFAMPNETKYHAIGMTPHIENKEIMHHILLYGCTTKPSADKFNGPFKCNMGMDGCQTIIGLWSVGINGECHPDQYGFPIGQGGYQYAVIQLHWNNPTLKTGLVDGSGLTLYYTDQLRPNDAMVVMTGQQYLEIPPQTASAKFQGSCTAACTNHMKPSTVKIAAAFLHMHYLGKAGSMELIQGGKVTQVLLNETSYDYNTPIVHKYTPIDFNAGDELRVSCEFSSLKTNANKTTYWGEGTQDEMCYVFVTIYPAVPGFDVCAQFVNLEYCSIPTYDMFGSHNCTVADFQQLLAPVMTHCSSVCTKVCRALLNGWYATGCMEGVVWEFWQKYLVQYSAKFLDVIPVINSCWPGQSNTSTLSSTSMLPSSATSTRPPAGQSNTTVPAGQSNTTVPVGQSNTTVPESPGCNAHINQGSHSLVSVPLMATLLLVTLLKVRVQ